MVKGMYLAKKQSKKGSEYFSLIIDFGYRKHEIMDFEKLLFPEMTGLNPEQVYSLKVGDVIPVAFDLTVNKK